jgi:hypothetical protein
MTSVLPQKCRDNISIKPQEIPPFSTPSFTNLLAFDATQYEILSLKKDTKIW